MAIAVTSLFAIRLVDLGYEGADALVPLVFSVVIVTIIAHGFSAGFVARWLDIDQGPGRSILIVGSNRWSVAFAGILKKQKLDVTIADESRAALRFAKREEIATYYGDVVEEAHGHDIDLGSYQQLLAITDNDAANRLIASDLGPEMGYEQIGMIAGDSEDQRYEGRSRILLKSGRDLDEMESLMREGWGFSCTNITDKFGWKEFQANLDDDEEAVAVLKPDMKLLLFTTDAQPQIEAEDILISFVKPDTPEERKAARKTKQVETNGK